MVEGFELITVAGDFITADTLVWRRYRQKSLGILEQLLDANPHLSIIHRETPFLPVGTIVRMPIDSDTLTGKPQPIEFIRIYGRDRSNG